MLYNIRYSGQLKQRVHTVCDSPSPLAQLPSAVVRLNISVPCSTTQSTIALQHTVILMLPVYRYAYLKTQNWT